MSEIRDAAMVDFKLFELKNSAKKSFIEIEYHGGSREPYLTRLKNRHNKSSLICKTVALRHRWLFKSTLLVPNSLFGVNVKQKL